jgi:hypothetical protein
MTGDRGPLSTFSNKILMGHALRIYDENTRCNLDIVRNIRNAFAHSKRPINFDHDLVIKELKKTNSPVNGRFKKDLARIKDLEHGPQFAYVFLCFVLSWVFSNRHISAIRSKNYRTRKKAAAKQVGLWTPPNPFLHPQPNIGGPGALASLGHQLYGPIPEAHGGLLAGLAHLGAKKPGSQDKKE